MVVKRPRLVWYLIYNNSLYSLSPETGFSSANSQWHTCRKSGEPCPFIKQFWLWSTVKKCYRIYFHSSSPSFSAYRHQIGASRDWISRNDLAFCWNKLINVLWAQINIPDRRNYLLDRTFHRRCVVSRASGECDFFLRYMRRLEERSARWRSNLLVIQSPGVLTTWLIKFLISSSPCQPSKLIDDLITSLEIVNKIKANDEFGNLGKQEEKPQNELIEHRFELL